MQVNIDFIVLLKKDFVALFSLFSNVFESRYSVYEKL